MTPAKRPAQGQDSSVESLNEENKVAVYCRIRGPLLTEEEPCVHIDDGKIVVLTPPEISRAYKGGNEARQYTFTKYVFFHFFIASTLLCIYTRQNFFLYFR